MGAEKQPPPHHVPPADYLQPGTATYRVFLRVWVYRDDGQRRTLTRRGLSGLAEAAWTRTRKAVRLAYGAGDSSMVADISIADDNVTPCLAVR